MKRKTLISTIGIMIVLLLASFMPAHKQKATKHRPFLEIAGKPVFENKTSNGTYKVTLIHLNRVVDTLVVPDNEPFGFKLDKNIIYSVRVEKAGFLPKLISINTKMPELYKEHIYYKFQFEVEMYRNDLEKYLDADDVDFPVAVVSYDEKADAYDYSRKYTECVIQRFEEARKAGDVVTRQ